MGFFARIKDLIAIAFAHSLGRPFVYPGSLRIMAFLFSSSILHGRKQMVETSGSLRNKLITKDDNSIDTMFIDRRKQLNPRGNILVIICEGNFGYYEFGTYRLPLRAGYSVLVWNHPGFASSTGLPYPSQERNAVEMVVKFAIYGLGFKEEEILIYGWSIGGFSSTWAAMAHPNILGLILDASFDDILPLAMETMPGILRPIVRLTIRRCFNLKPADQLAKYHGPVTIIRRTQDEIIATDRKDPLTNRGNDLLLSLLKTRYPNLITITTKPILLHLLSNQVVFHDIILNEYHVSSQSCSSILASYIE